MFFEMDCEYWLSGDVYLRIKERFEEFFFFVYKVLLIISGILGSFNVVC